MSCSLQSLQDAQVIVNYEMYEGLPLVATYVQVVSSVPLRIDSLTTEIISAPEDVLNHGWSTGMAGLLTASSITGRLHVTSEVTRGATTTVLQADPNLHTQAQGWMKGQPEEEEQDDDDDDDEDEEKQKKQEKARKRDSVFV